MNGLEGIKAINNAAREVKNREVARPLGNGYFGFVDHDAVGIEKSETRTGKPEVIIGRQGFRVGVGPLFSIFNAKYDVLASKLTREQVLNHGRVAAYPPTVVGAALDLISDKSISN